MTIGERIKKLREEKGMSVDKLAELIGKNRATIYRYESNDIEKLPTSVLEPLCKALGTTPAYLMGWETGEETTEENSKLTDNTELQEYLEELKSRSEMRMLFSLAKGATKEDVEKAVKIIEALKEDD